MCLKDSQYLVFVFPAGAARLFSNDHYANDADNRVEDEHSQLSSGVKVLLIKDDDSAEHVHQDESTCVNWPDLCLIVHLHCVVNKFYLQSSSC